MARRSLYSLAAPLSIFSIYFAIFSSVCILPAAFVQSIPSCLKVEPKRPNYLKSSTEVSTESPDLAHSNPQTKKRQLVGAENFVRHNPKSERFEVKKFHHVQFYCGDAQNTARRFQFGLGMTQIAKSDLSTGNTASSNICLQSGDLCFLFTAPYGIIEENADTDSVNAFPGFDKKEAHDFFMKHGLAAKAVGIEVEDAEAAYEACVANGGRGVLSPVTIQGEQEEGSVTISEVELYGDVVLRFLSFENYKGSFLPNFELISESPANPSLSYGLYRLDHAVGNVWDLMEQVEYVGKMTGFHEFAEFTAEDVGTVDSGLNSVVMASNNEMVLLPLNEPTYGTKRKSQIQTYLEQNGGPGLQHLALYTQDIFHTMTKMREMSAIGGFEFMPRPSATYYPEIREKFKDDLSPDQLDKVEELGLLVDKDDQGILLQIFTKPVGDRPTLFLEIIQRIGCMYEDEQGNQQQKGGCGGFGKGNFRELFKSIEEYEKTLEID
mmetsp:Transcript_35799/g.45951  ORF Transcript_35799/g.45951 Transcript_35799/m.45951 type:complete len:493 (+) Transcript_35799:72-1550(+)